MTKSLKSDGLSQTLKVKNAILNRLIDIESLADSTLDAIKKPDYKQNADEAGSTSGLKMLLALCVGLVGYLA